MKVRRKDGAKLVCWHYCEVEQCNGCPRDKDCKTCENKKRLALGRID
jgi:hypothetical protein